MPYHCLNMVNILVEEIVVEEVRSSNNLLNIEE